MACADFRRTYACWRWNGARQKRPMNSIVLEPSVKEMLLADCRDFLRSEDWYVYYLEFIGIRREHLVCRYAERGGFIKRCARKRTCTYSPVSVRDTLPPWLPFAWCAREVRCVLNVIHALTSPPKRQDFAHSFARWRTWIGHICCQSLIQGVRIRLFPTFPG
jgi:hypothetical protein